jgi:hypothetical protein
MVLCVLNSTSNSYIITGVIGQHELRNDFVNRFLNALERSNVNYRNDNFDACVIEVQREDFPAFIEQLTLDGNNM